MSNLYVEAGVSIVVNLKQLTEAKAKTGIINRLISMLPVEVNFQQAQGPKTPRPITVHFKKSPSSSALEVGMWYLL